MQPPLFIINPTCGTRKAGDEIAKLLARVGHLHGEVTVHYTERRGHAEELAYAGVGDGHPLIVAVGGDGTFSDVVNGVLRAGDEAAVAASGGKTAGNAWQNSRPSGWSASVREAIFGGLSGSAPGSRRRWRRWRGEWIGPSM